MLLFTGGTAPVFAPLSPDGSIDYDFIGYYGDYLHSKHVRNVFINGTSGEFCSLSVCERARLLEAWKSQHGDKFKLIVHVGGCSLADTLTLTRHALTQQVDAVAVIAPFFLPPSNVQSLLNYFKKIAEVISSSSAVPLFYYHIPSLTHCQVDLVEFVSRALVEVDHFKGMKFTDDNAPLLRQCQQQFGDKMQIFCGLESLYAEALTMGIQEGIFAMFNFAPNALFALQQFVLKHSNLSVEEVLASKEFANVQKVLQVREKYAQHGAIPILKDLARVSGLSGLGQVRLPLQSLNEDELVALARDLSPCEV